MKSRSQTAIDAVLANFNSMARGDGTSPATLFHGRHIRLPGTPAFPTPEINMKEEKEKRQRRQQEVRGRTQKRPRSLFGIRVGDSVMLKTPPGASRGTYTVGGTVIKVKDGGLSYEVIEWNSLARKHRSIRHIRPTKESPPKGFKIPEEKADRVTTKESTGSKSVSFSP